jgi:serine/threonine protein kinase
MNIKRFIHTSNPAFIVARKYYWDYRKCSFHSVGVYRSCTFGREGQALSSHNQYLQYNLIMPRLFLKKKSYSSSIDMWSLGCIAVELFLGLPLFPGSSEYNQISRIVEMLGVPPVYMIEVGKSAHHYFERYLSENGQKKYRLKSMEQYMREHSCREQPSKRYFQASTLPEIIKSYPITRKGLSQKETDKGKIVIHLLILRCVCIYGCSICTVAFTSIFYFILYPLSSYSFSIR